MTPASRPANQPVAQRRAAKHTAANLLATARRAAARHTTPRLLLVPAMGLSVYLLAAAANLAWGSALGSVMAALLILGPHLALTLPMAKAPHPTSTSSTPDKRSPHQSPTPHPDASTKADRRR